jgi:hypothetical protein
MAIDTIESKPEAHNYRGFFVQEASHRLGNLDHADWACICLHDGVFYYVEPEDLELAMEPESGEE